MRKCSEMLENPLYRDAEAHRVSYHQWYNKTNAAEMSNVGLGFQESIEYRTS